MIGETLAIKIFIRIQTNGDKPVAEKTSATIGWRQSILMHHCSPSIHFSLKAAREQIHRKSLVLGCSEKAVKTVTSALIPKNAFRTQKV